MAVKFDLTNVSCVDYFGYGARAVTRSGLVCNVTTVIPLPWVNQFYNQLVGTRILV